MKINDIYDKLETKVKIEFLSNLIFFLTVGARDVPNNTDGYKAYQGFNELIHSVSGQLVSLTGMTEDYYPADVFWNILFEHAENYICMNGFQFAIESSMDKVNIQL